MFGKKKPPMPHDWPLPDDEIERFHAQGITMMRDASDAKLKEIKQSVKARRNMTAPEYARFLDVRLDQVRSNLLAVSLLRRPEVREFFGFNRPDHQFWFDRGYNDEMIDILQDFDREIGKLVHLRDQMGDGTTRLRLAKEMGVFGLSMLEKTETMLDFMLWYAKVFSRYWCQWAGMPYVNYDYMDSIQTAIEAGWIKKVPHPETQAPYVVIWLPDDAPEQSKRIYRESGMVNGWPLVRY